jgi:hypothetical protein
MQRSPVAKYARGAVARLKRKLGGSREAHLEAELRATRRKLRKARKELREARAQLASGLPPDIERTIAEARAERLTYLKPANLRELASIVQQIERERLRGVVIEAGAARGGSAIVLAAAKAPERPM